MRESIMKNEGTDAGCNESMMVEKAMFNQRKDQISSSRISFNKNKIIPQLFRTTKYPQNFYKNLPNARTSQTVLVPPKSNATEEKSGSEKILTRRAFLSADFESAALVDTKCKNSPYCLDTPVVVERRYYNKWARMNKPKQVTAQDDNRQKLRPLPLRREPQIETNMSYYDRNQERQDNGRPHDQNVDVIQYRNRKPMSIEDCNKISDSGDSDDNLSVSTDVSIGTLSSVTRFSRQVEISLPCSEPEDYEIQKSCCSIWEGKKERKSAKEKMNNPSNRIQNTYETVPKSPMKIPVTSLNFSGPDNVVMDVPIKSFNEQYYRLRKYANPDNIFIDSRQISRSKFRSFNKRRGRLEYLVDGTQYLNEQNVNRSRLSAANAMDISEYLRDPPQFPSQISRNGNCDSVSTEPVGRPFFLSGINLGISQIHNPRPAYMKL